MRKQMIFALLIAAAMLVPAAVAQGFGKECTIAGTWYGGSEVKYLATITPITGERFSARFELVASLQYIPYSAWTSWSGEFRKAQVGYVGQSVSMYTTSPAFPPSGDSYEVDAVRSSLEFIDCDNITITYDFYGIYLDLNKVPFVDQPDLGGDIPAPGMVESYHRVPNTCPICGSSATLALQGRRKH